MSTVRTTPATARTDVRPEPAAAAVVTTPTSTSDRMLRWCGAGVTAGALTFAPAWFVPTQDAATGFAMDLTGLVFQLGVFCLLVAMWHTRALGTSRLARGMLMGEFVLLTVATVQSAATLPSRGGEWNIVATVLDPFWPISMLGMAILGIKLAVAGRWRGALRVWPVVAESWFPFVGLVALLLPEPFVGPVAGAHFVLGYGVLGLLLLARPDLTRR